MKNLQILLVVLTSVLVINAQAKRAVKSTPKSTTQVEPQSKPSQKVVIEKLNGDKLTGLFVSGGIDSIVIDLDGSRISVKLSDLALIRIGDTPVKIESPISKDNEAIDNALKSLRKIAAATESGINFQEYSRRLIDVKIEVEEFIANLPDSTAKTEIKLALESYEDAKGAWNWINGSNPIGRPMGDMFPDYEPGKSLQQKYHIPTYTDGGSRLMEGHKAIKVIWETAIKHIENAAAAKTKHDVK